MMNFCDSAHAWLLDQRWRSIWQTTLQYRLRDENEQTSDFKTSLPFTMSNILFLFLFFACRPNVSIVNTQCLLYMNALHFYYLFVSKKAETTTVFALYSDFTVVSLYWLIQGSHFTLHIGTFYYCRYVSVGISTTFPFLGKL